MKECIDSDGSTGKTNPSSRPPGGEWTPLKIIVVYILVSAVWILVSDRLTSALVKDPRLFILVQTIKGWGFILVTGWLLYGLIQRYTRTLEQAQASLRDREAWYRRLITTAEEGIWALDVDHRVTFVNQRLAEILGYDIDEMLGHPIFDFVDPAWRDDLAGHLEMRLQGAREVYETRLRCKDGAERWVIASATPIFDDQGHPLGSFAMLTDITERHQFEEFQREFARRTIEAATEGKLLIRTREEIIQMAGPPLVLQAITRVEDLELARHTAEEMARRSWMDEERIFDFVLCISEATTNAFKHAGGGTLSLHCVEENLLAVISDHGPGIQAINLPEVALRPGYTTAMSLGMGYKAMISLTDHVYLATGPEGTVVAIEMALHTPKAPPVTIPAALDADW
ncbi:MAG: PAS domain S-box protein [Armatimonadota bacterium]